jgi:hypothetical protein
MYRVPPLLAETAETGPCVENVDLEQAVAIRMRPRLTTAAADLLARIWWCLLLVGGPSCWWPTRIDAMKAYPPYFTAGFTPRLPRSG